MRNQNLKAAIENVFAKTYPTMAVLSLTLMSETDVEFKYEPLFIERYGVAQRYGDGMEPGTASYTDEIFIEFPISTRDYIAINNRAQGLLATLIVKLTDNVGIVRSRFPPQVKTYVAVIVDPVDYTRLVPDAHLRPSPDVKMTLRLIEKEIYELRHFGINAIYEKATVDAAIADIAHRAKVPYFSMPAKADNRHVRDHLVIPPVKMFDEVFAYIQSRYGVYMKGLNYYFSEKTLHIFPAYEMEPVTPQKVQFYVTDRGDYSGLTSFHREENDTISIVLQGVSDMVDLSIAAAENDGTARMFLRSSQLVDGFVETSENGVIINNEAALSIKDIRSRPSIASANKNVYAKPTDNPFAQAELLEKNRAMLVKTRWKMAVPFLIKPNTGIRFTYDDKGQIKTHLGIIEQANYLYTKIDRTGDGVIHSCTAELILRIEPAPLPV